VEDTELEFCKECGMEFLEGRGMVCPLCGNRTGLKVVGEILSVVGGDIGDYVTCNRCKKQYLPTEDGYFMFSDVGSSVWVETDYETCAACLLPRFNYNHPDFAPLKEVGLSITVENWRKFWGLSASEILGIIDSGGDIENLSRMVRQGVALEKIKLVERVMNMGISVVDASLMTQRGLLLKHVKQIEKSSDVYSMVNRLFRFLDLDSVMKVDEAFLWLEIDLEPSEVNLWRVQGFLPKDAAEWSNEGFSSDIATRWRAIGVNSLSVAKRRRDAGLNP
jgi:hypothetical protein